jgi:ABC-type nitrate/sulfonate/bicarbonate transport system permease component
MLAANTGIGGLISLYAFAINKQGLWAAVIALSTTTMTFYTLVLIAQRVFVPWRQER